MRRISIAVTTLALVGTLAPVRASHDAWVCSATPSVLVTSESCSLPVGCPEGLFSCVWSVRVRAEGIGLVRGRLHTSTGTDRAECGTFVFSCRDRGTFTLPPGGEDVLECEVSGIAIQVRIACSAGIDGHE